MTRISILRLLPAAAVAGLLSLGGCVAGPDGGYPGYAYNNGPGPGENGGYYRNGFGRGYWGHGGDHPWPQGGSDGSGRSPGGTHGGDSVGGGHGAGGHGH